MRERVTPADPQRAEALAIVHQLREVALRLDLAIGEFARTTGLHPTDVRALVRLLDAERAAIVATPSWLAQQLGMTSQATTAVLRRLEGAGHLERVRSPEDGRSVRLQVSDSAVELGWSFFGPLLEGLIAVTAELPAEHREILAGYLSTARAVLGQSTKNAPA